MHTSIKRNKLIIFWQKCIIKVHTWKQPNSMYYCNRYFRNGIRYPRCTACCPHRLSKVYSVILARSGSLCERWQTCMQGFSLIIYDGFTRALKTTDKDMAAVTTLKHVLENLFQKLLAMKTCQCPNLLHVKDATFKYTKRGASLMYIHFHLRVR